MEISIKNFLFFQSNMTHSCQVWNMDLKRKYTCDFEEYQNNSEDMLKQEIHIYIALDK